MITKNSLLKFSALALLVLLVPTLVFAAPFRPLKSTADNATGTAGKLKPAATAAVCTRIDAFMEKLQLGLGQANTRLADAQQERIQKLKDRADKNDEQLNGIRDKADENRLQHYEKLKARAQTEEQKQAAQTFIDTVEKAVETRQAAVNAAIEAYRNGLADATKIRQSAIQQAKKNFEAAVTAAKNKAKADCATLDAAAVRTQLLAALQAARKQLVTDIQAADKIQTKLEQLRKTRRQAVLQAFKAFDEAFKAALAELKAAFPQPTDASSGSPTSTESE